MKNLELYRLVHTIKLGDSYNHREKFLPLKDKKVSLQLYVNPNNELEK